MSSNIAEHLTSKIYSDLETAWDYYNRELFEGKLPPVLLVMSYHRSAYGYFRSKPFVPRDQLEAYDEWQIAVQEEPEESQALNAMKPGIDEVSLNIFAFRERTVPQIMSTLVHEAVHCQQHHYGKPPKRPSHNKEWATMMKAVGLYPSATGEPGGKETGRRVSHYIVEGGPFDLATKNLPVTLDWVGMLPTRKKKERTPKVTYKCPTCEIKVRGNVDLKIRCDEDDVLMEAQ